VQITAEQLLREATERLGGEGLTKRKPFVDKENSYEYKLQQRQKFEDILRHQRDRIGTWVQYARLEEKLGEWDRARSVYERSLDADPRCATLWLKYAEMETRLGNPNLARNVWDRAVTILPRMDQFWYKYAYLEERLGDIGAARAVWERWMRWEPEEACWLTYAKFEKRQKEFGRVRGVFGRMLELYPTASGWGKWAHFEEEEAKDISNARAVWERALDTIGSSSSVCDVDASDQLDTSSPSLFIEFAKFEVRQGEIDRARALYKLALSLFSKSDAQGLYHSYAAFEKQHGTPETIQDVVLVKRRAGYEAQLAKAPHDYDGWMAYVRLEEMEGQVQDGFDVVRDVYERAIAQVPPSQEKRHWRRYIYIWLYYALFEETVAQDMERAHAIYRTALQLVPHARFTFAKLWLAQAHFLLRRHDLSAARKLLGQALGRCPKSRLYTGYIEMELELREFDRARILYGKFLEWAPERAGTWCKYAELEALLGDEDRARAIYELAISSEEQGILLDQPELVWKAYIDWEYEEGRLDAARGLYERLLERTGHIKVWVSYATFEASMAEEVSPTTDSAAQVQSNTADSADGMARARAILQRASDYFKTAGPSHTAERLLLMEAWRELEQAHGTAAALAALLPRLPRRLLKRRKIQMADGASGWEEYAEYAFPDDDQGTSGGHAKLLEMAHKWKEARKKPQ